MTLDLLNALKKVRKHIFKRLLIFITHSFDELIILKIVIKIFNNLIIWLNVILFLREIMFFDIFFKKLQTFYSNRMFEVALKQYRSYEIQRKILHGFEPGTEYLKNLVENFLNI